MFQGAENEISEKNQSPETIHECEDCIEVLGARVHNLRNIDLIIPRNKLVVITGLSGSGKSSLAFDTIYAEGQRRYIETFSAYARQFLGNLERPDVDKISGLSPVISIEQKSTNKNPRSTVGTITEIYDFMRLLFARIADAYSYKTGEKMVKYPEEQLFDIIISAYENKNIGLLCPVVKRRKGHYQDLFDSIAKKGFVKVRVDGKVMEIKPGMQLDRYKIHDIEILIDSFKITAANHNRLVNSMRLALKQGNGELMVLDIENEATRFFSKHLMCPSSGISYQEPEPNSFSFNSPYGACTKCNGLGIVPEMDLNKMIPDFSKSIKQGAFANLIHNQDWIIHNLEALCEVYDKTLNTPLSDFPEELIQKIFHGTEEILKIKNPHLGITYTSTFPGLINYLTSKTNDNGSVSAKRKFELLFKEMKCPECEGSRLKKEMLYFKIAEKNIAELAQLDIIDLLNWFEKLEKKLTSRQWQIGYEVVREITTRTKFLVDVGLEYLTLHRSTRSLSGGEAQRIRLATQIGSQLVGVLYILDEPSIGLHQRDNHRLINALKNLRDMGNSVIVVEHDYDMMAEADHIIDMGPMAGISGGKVVAHGTVDEIKKQNSITAQYLNKTKTIAIPKERRKGNGKFLQIKGAKGNNLKNINVKFPLGTMICVTGVSGSGKSSLINETIYPYLSNFFYNSDKTPLPFKIMDGHGCLDKVIEIDQSPIGRTPRSNPATYVGVWDEIRKLYAQLPEAKIRGYEPGRFSFNIKGGRCETCQGGGMKAIEMNFLPDVYVLCETCNGKRYNRETLEVRYKGKSINDVLNMTITQALEFFENIPAITRKIKTMQEVGLGYISLGQSSTTLSGGEAQRVKLATELSKKDTGKTFYILDEPTTGLHFEDIRILLEVLDKLVDKGNTVLIIEHNLDVIKVADYIVDLGPEGGARGGEIICTGSPEQIIKNTNSYTAQYLKPVLKEK